jgi:uncharacterized protein YukE
VTDLKTPPQKDFTDYSGLLNDQAGHFTTLKNWSTDECAQTGGLDGVLEVLREIVPKVSGFFNGQLSHCETGMHTVVGKVKETSGDYAHTEHKNTVQLQGVYGKPLAGFPDIGATPGMPRAGDFKDEPVTLKQPASAEDDTAHSIHTQLRLMKGGELKKAEKIFKWCTGKSLIGILIDPLFGEFGRLKYLQEAFAELSDGTYTVAGTLRKGSWSLADEWTGQSATAFDSYMFRWTMGTGGIGDAAKEVSDAYKTGYDTIVALVYLVLRDINTLINDEIKAMIEQGEKALGGDAAIEAAGGGPEDPLADIGAGIYTAYRLYKLYKIVRTVVSIIITIDKTIDKIREAVAALKTAAGKVTTFLKDPGSLNVPSVGSLVNDVEQNGFTFEKQGGWPTGPGAARISMLPPAQ